MKTDSRLVTTTDLPHRKNFASGKDTGICPMALEDTMRMTILDSRGARRILMWKIPIGIVGKGGKMRTFCHGTSGFTPQ